MPDCHVAIHGLATGRGTSTIEAGTAQTGSPVVVQPAAAVESAVVPRPPVMIEPDGVVEPDPETGPPVVAEPAVAVASAAAASPPVLPVETPLWLAADDVGDARWWSPLLLRLLDLA